MKRSAMRRFLQPLVLVLALSLPVSAADSFFLTHPTFDSIPTVGLRPAIAGGGEGYLAAWSMVHQGIWVVPLDQHGRATVPALRLSETAEWSPPSLIWNGTGYFLGFSSAGYAHVLELDRSGRVVRRANPLATGDAAVKMGWSGRRLLVVSGLSSGVASETLSTFLLNRELEVLKSDSFTAGRYFAFDVAGGSDVFFLTIVAWSGLSGKWLSADGEMESELTIKAADGTSLEARRAVAATSGIQGGGVVVVWNTAHQSAEDELWSAFVDRGGALVSENRLSVGGFPDVLGLDLEETWQGWVLAFGSGRQAGQSDDFFALSVLRLDPQGRPRDSGPSVIAGSPNRAYFAGLARNNDRYTALFSESTVLGSHHVSVVFSGEPIRRDGAPNVVSYGSTHQQGAQVAGGNDEFLSVWVERSSHSQAIYAGRISRRGERLDGRGILIHSVGGFIGSPAVAFGSTDYLVVWQHGVELLARRVSASGEILDDPPIVIAIVRMAGKPAVAFDGNNFLISWVHNGRIWGSLLTPAGTPSAPRPLSPELLNTETSLTDHSDPTVVSNGRDFLLSFTVTDYAGCIFPVCEFPQSVALIRVSPNGIPIDADAVTLGARIAAVSTDGRDYLAVFPGSDALYAVLIQTHGEEIVVTEPKPILRWRVDSRPLVIWSGDSYLATFPLLSAAGRVLVFKRLDSQANVLETWAENMNERELYESISRAGSGVVMIAGHRYANEPPYHGSPRVVGRLATPPPGRRRIVFR